MTASRREIQSGSIASSVASFVERWIVLPPATSTVRPSTCFSRSAGSRATSSMAPACSARVG